MNKKDTKIIIIYTIITLIFFGMLIKLEYATDTYAVFNFNKEEIYNQFASSGRFVTAIVGKIIKTLGISEKGIYLGSYFLAIVSTVLSQFILYKIIEKNIKNKIQKILIPTLIIINPFSIELFLFIEKGIMMLSVLLCIIAVETTIKYFEIKEKKYIFLSALIMFLAFCSYQGTGGIYVSLLLIFIIKYSKTWKEFIINNFLVISTYIIPAAINYVITKIILKSNRVNGQIIIKESINRILKNTINMILKTYNLLPKYLFILVILFTFIYFCCKIWKERKKLLHLAEISYILFGVILVSILPQLMQPTNLIWFVPRATYSFASLYGILLLYFFIKYNNTKLVFLVISFILLFSQVNTFYNIQTSRYRLNSKDYEVTSKIVKQIEQYEKSTGNKITRNFNI